MTPPINRPSSPNFSSLENRAVSPQGPQTTGPYGLVRKFFSPSDDRSYQFGPRDPYTVVLRSHPAVEQSRTRLSQMLQRVCSIRPAPGPETQITTPVRYTPGGGNWWQALWDFGSTMLGFTTGGILGKQPEYGVIGSFGFQSKVKLEDINCDKGTAQASFDIVNDMSAPSFTRYSYSSPDATLLDPNPFGEHNPLGTVTQRWTWDERVDANDQRD